MTRDDEAVRTARVEALYRDAGPAVLAYLARRTNPDHAADLFSEVLVVLWRRRADLPSDDQARLWLFGVARNVLLSHHRRAVRHRAVAEAVARELAVAHAAAPETDDRVVLLKALATLNDADREIVQLSSWEQLTSTEIGGLLSIPPETVRTRLRRARAKLRGVLEQDDQDDPHAAPALHSTP